MISLVVSKGPVLVEVPDVRPDGRSRRRRKRLEAAGFRVERARRRASTSACSTSSRPTPRRHEGTQGQHGLRQRRLTRTPSPTCHFRHISHTGNVDRLATLRGRSGPRRGQHHGPSTDGGRTCHFPDAASNRHTDFPPGRSPGRGDRLVAATAVALLPPPPTPPRSGRPSSPRPGSPVAGPPRPRARAAHGPPRRDRDRAGGPLPRVDRRADPPEPPRLGNHALPGQVLRIPVVALRRTPRRRPDPQARGKSAKTTPPAHEARTSARHRSALSIHSEHASLRLAGGGCTTRCPGPRCASLVARDGPALRRPAPARARDRLAGVRLAAAPGLQRRRPRRDAGDAGHRPLDAVVRRTPAAAARHPRQHPGRGADPADPARAGRGTTATRSPPTTRGSAPCAGTGYFKDTKRYVASVRAHERNLKRTGSPI